MTREKATMLAGIPAFLLHAHLNLFLANFGISPWITNIWLVGDFFELKEITSQLVLFILLAVTIVPLLEAAWQRSTPINYPTKTETALLPSLGFSFGLLLLSCLNMVRFTASFEMFLVGLLLGSIAHFILLFGILSVLEKFGLSEEWGPGFNSNKPWEKIEEQKSQSNSASSGNWRPFFSMLAYPAGAVAFFGFPTFLTAAVLIVSVPEADLSAFMTACSNGLVPILIILSILGGLFVLLGKAINNVLFYWWIPVLEGKAVNYTMGLGVFLSVCVWSVQGTLATSSNPEMLQASQTPLWLMTTLMIASSICAGIAFALTNKAFAKPEVPLLPSTAVFD